MVLKNTAFAAIYIKHYLYSCSYLPRMELV